jgi:hypothetical protein
VEGDSSIVPPDQWPLVNPIGPAKPDPGQDFLTIIEMSGNCHQRT